MKRILQMTSNDTAYIVSEGAKQLLTIEKTKMKITGFDLYDKVFKDTPKGEILKIDVVGRETLEGKGKIVYDRFKELIDAIVNEINNALGPTEQSESAPTDVKSSDVDSSPITQKQ